MDTLFKSSSNFASLSLNDLIEARDLFHYHLMNKKNVVATALGLYRIRKTDPWPAKHHPAQKKRSPESKRRTLFNSEVRPYSWPCVYVFVSSWEYEKDLAEVDPSDVVPKTLYLPDGRTVPICVIEARKQPLSKDLKIRLDGRTPRNLLAPGSAIVNEDGQGMTRLATAGCVVRDSERYFVLTNKHAIGEAGTEILALQTHRRRKIGVSAKKGLGRQDLKAIYPNFPSTKQRLLMDVGLVELDDILQWKTEFPGIAPIGPVLDLYDNSFSLKLITMKVVGQSAISGRIKGEIHGLFYRYKAMGGSEYVCDFLIGPETYGLDERLMKAEETAESRNGAENVAFSVHHGDSGTVLFIEHSEKSEDDEEDAGKTTYYPFALLWGKEEFFEDGESLTQPYALASSLGTALDQLDLDFVRDINLDQDYIWGWVGHYIIGRSLPLSADLVTSPKLQSLLDKNIDLLAITPDNALGNDPRVLEGDDPEAHFVPLADVPDNVWKSNVNFTMVEGPDGKKHRKIGPGSRGQTDNANHYADLDLICEDGKTFLELNDAAPDRYLNPDAWIAYFAAMKPQYDAWAKLLDPNSAPQGNHWGALPFRVHQLFDVMAKAAKDGDAAIFVCAGGVLIHYIGDACQPLHTSYLSQGDPARVVKRPTSSKMKLEADGVHSGYEDDMIAYGYQKDQLGKKLPERIKALEGEAIPAILNGYDASKAVIALIVATQSELAPRDIVDSWVELTGRPAKEKAADMWEDFGDRTITCMARGTRYLAKIWQAAWDAGNGDAHMSGNTDITEADIMARYNNPDIVPSVALNRYPKDPLVDWSAIRRSAQA